LNEAFIYVGKKFVVVPVRSFSARDFHAKSYIEARVLEFVLSPCQHLWGSYLEGPLVYAILELKKAFTGLSTLLNYFGVLEGGSHSRECFTPDVFERRRGLIIVLLIVSLPRGDVQEGDEV